jgi:uncharacterized cupredoxin-like copper-binding protein
VKRGLLGIGATAALTLVAAAAVSHQAQSAVQPLTTAPPQVITIKIMISDTAIRMTPKSAPRGAMGRFILVNTGKKRHTFALGHERRQTGTQTGFTRTLGPGQQAILLLYLDYRGTVPYLGTLPTDRLKAAMKGTFRIT